MASTTYGGKQTRENDWFVGAEGSRHHAVKRLSGIREQLFRPTGSEDVGYRRREYVVGTAGIGKTSAIKLVFNARCHVLHVSGDTRLGDLVQQIESCCTFEKLPSAEDMSLCANSDLTFSEVGGLEGKDDSTRVNVLHSLGEVIRTTEFKNTTVVIIDTDAFPDGDFKELRELIGAFESRSNVFIFVEHVGERVADIEDELKREVPRFDASTLRVPELQPIKVVPFRPLEVVLFICGKPGFLPVYCLEDGDKKAHCETKRVAIKEILQQVGCHPGMLESVRRAMHEMHDSLSELGLVSRDRREEYISQCIWHADHELADYTGRLLGIARYERAQDYEQLIQWADKPEGGLQQRHLRELHRLALCCSSRKVEGWKIPRTLGVQTFPPDDDTRSDEQWWIPEAIREYIQNSPEPAEKKRQEAGTEDSEIWEWFTDKWPEIVEETIGEKSRSTDLLRTVMLRVLRDPGCYTSDDLVKVESDLNLHAGNVDQANKAKYIVDSEYASADPLHELYKVMRYVKR